MRTFTMIAAGLLLAGGVVVAWAGQAQEGEEPAVAAGQAEVSVKDQPVVARARRLAVLDGAGLELGVSVSDLDAGQSGTLTGARVDDVRSGSPAEKAGIRHGDVITTFDGERVRSARHLARLVGETAEGHAVPLAVVRDGQTLTLTATPERAAGGRHLELLAPHAFEGGGLPRFPADGLLGKALPGWRDGDGGWELLAPGQPRLGIGVQDLTPQLAEYFGVERGVLVTSVEPDSPAASAGLKAGDVIISVNGTGIGEASALVEAIRKAGSGATVAIEYQRDRKGATATATLPDRERRRQPRTARPV